MDRIATTSWRVGTLFTRQLSSSSFSRFPKTIEATGEASSSSESGNNNRPSRSGPRKNFDADYDVRNLQEYRFDDATSLGWLRLENIREAQELFRKVEVDREALRAQSRPFKQPSSTQNIRIRSTIDLSNPDSSLQTKAVLIAPVTSLPLSGPEAIHRLKVLAGPRWTPGYPGRYELESSANGATESKEGWIKISEERFRDGQVNRRSAGEMLQRLVEAANDPKSPITPALPLDSRHLLARQSKKKHRSAAHVWQRSEAMKARSEVVGGVRGFPKEWLDQEAV